jgi:hypothetical protein
MKKEMQKKRCGPGIARYMVCAAGEGRPLSPHSFGLYEDAVAETFGVGGVVTTSRFFKRKYGRAALGI